MERENNGKIDRKKQKAQQGVNNQENNVKGRKAKKLTEKGEMYFYRFSQQAEQVVDN